MNVGMNAPSVEFAGRGKNLARAAAVAATLTVAGVGADAAVAGAQTPKARHAYVKSDDKPRGHHYGWNRGHRNPHRNCGGSQGGGNQGGGGDIGSPGG